MPLVGIDFDLVRDPVPLQELLQFIGAVHGNDAVLSAMQDQNRRQLVGVGGKRPNQSPEKLGHCCDPRILRGQRE